LLLICAENLNKIDKKMAKVNQILCAGIIALCFVNAVMCDNETDVEGSDEYFLMNFETKFGVTSKNIFKIKSKKQS